MIWSERHRVHWFEATFGNIAAQDINAWNDVAGYAVSW